MAYKILIEPIAKFDIQEGITYYNLKQQGLGKKFHKEVLTYIATIKSNLLYQIKYDDVRCLPLKKFPFMIHFTINETHKTIIIRAVFHTSLNPASNWS